MQLKTLDKSLKFGIPHSKLIDKILSLRDKSINFNYYQTYLYEDGITMSHYILPIFSFKDSLYWIGSIPDKLVNSWSFYIGGVTNDLQKKIKKCEDISSMFYDLNISSSDFEHLLIERIKDNEELLKYLIEN